MNHLLDETKFILRKYGISANKSLGQNFLINEEVIEQMIEKAEISNKDLVIEIGPGIGTLTKELLKTAGKVIAIEVDKRMIEILLDRFKLYSNFELINEDILKVNVKEIIKKAQNKLEQENAPNQQKEQEISTKENNKHFRVKVVANLPYYITTPIIMKLLEEDLPIDSITVMIQKEVADRLVEKPGGKNAGAITYSVHYYAIAKEIIKVMPNSFIPEPSVESKVIQLEIRKEKNIKVENPTFMFEIIKYAFMKRRKTFVNALEKSNLFNNKEEIIQILQKLGLDKQIRGEALSLEDYANFTNFVTKM